MKLYPLVIAGLLAFFGVGLSAHPFSCFPRMVNQQNIRPFERTMPAMPSNAIPFTDSVQLPESATKAAGTDNPLLLNTRTLHMGKIYYGYYCAMCHGDNGKGDGLVGRSYIPKPSDLTDPKYSAMTDGEIAYRMTAGKGHEPVLDTTVPVARRWYVVYYMRTL